MSQHIQQERMIQRGLDSLEASPSSITSQGDNNEGNSSDERLDPLDTARRRLQSAVETRNIVSSQSSQVSQSQSSAMRSPTTNGSASPSALRSPSNRLPPRRKTYEALSVQAQSQSQSQTPAAAAAGIAGIGIDSENEHGKGSLQDRVDELETKLAVLSMLLQRSLLKGGGGTGVSAAGGEGRDNYKFTAATHTPPLQTPLQTPSDPMQMQIQTPLSPPLPPSPPIPVHTDLMHTMSMDTSRDDDNDSVDSDIASSADRHSRSSSQPHLESPAPFSAGKTPPRSHRFNNGMLDDMDDSPSSMPSPPLGVVPMPVSPPPNERDKRSMNNTLGMIPNNVDATFSEPSTPPRANGSRLRMQLSAEEEQNRNGDGDGVAILGNADTDMVSLFQQLPPAQSRQAAAAAAATATPDPDTLAPPALPRPVGSNQRNLSFRLLYDGEEAEYQQEKKMQTAPPALSSLTLAERSWLRPKILQFSKEQREQAARDAEDMLEQQQQQQLEQDDTVRNKWLNYLNSFQESTPDVDVQMQEFIKVPGMVEHVMGFGMFICLDSFLYMVTILPIRFVWSCFLLLLHLVSSVSWKQKPVNPAFQFHRRHTYQMIQVTILYTIYRYVLSAISIGKLYHWIRGQAMIKIYVIMAIVEVFDRLMCSLGQDCLDSMYWNSVSRPRSSRMLISVLVVLVYSTIHAVILFVHVETLNVAMNSADQALLTLLISGNFAEIKSTVFKKYNKPALFKITAADVCERFKLSLFLSLVLLLNMCQGMDASMFYDYMRICGIIWFAEVLADWIKHSFITKFNFLPAKVYPEYALLLAGDVTGIGHEGVNLDHSHAVVKRMGLAQLPLVCVMFRILGEAAKYLLVRQAVSPFALWTGGFGVWLLLLVTKIVLGTMLQRIALAKLLAAPEVSQTPMSKKKKKL